MKTDLEYNYLGDSIKDSLLKYGMICRSEKSDQFYFIYKVNEAYEEGFISESDISEFMNGETGFSKKEIMTFLKNVVQTNFMDFIKMPILEKVYKLSNHFGVEVILGKSISPLTFANVMNIIEND